MKLRNKKTGEIFECKTNGKEDSLWKKQGTSIVLAWKIDEHLWEGRDYNSLAELNEEWEDAPEEPKGIKSVGTIGSSVHIEFKTEEEAERAVEKLKAWKRLKDKGFRFTAWYGGSKDISFSIRQKIIDKPTAEDLNLLFGGEE